MKMKQTLHSELVAKFNKPFIGVDEICELLDIPKRTLQQNMYTGRFNIPTFSVGRNKMVRLSDLADYIDAQCALSAAEIKELN